MTKKIIDVNKILAKLPHRYPFVFVDFVKEISLQEELIVGVKNVSINENFFVGHFPGRAVMPGVLIVEALAQVSAILANEILLEKKTNVLLTSIDGAKFRKVVEPGDVLELHSKILMRRGNLWKFRTMAKVQEHLVAQADLGAVAFD